MQFLFKKGYVSEVFYLLFLPFSFWWRTEFRLLLEQSMKTMFISWKDVFESATTEGISCSAAVAMGYFFGFSAANLSETVPRIPVWIARLQIQVSSLLVSAFALTVQALSQRQRDLIPSQVTSGIKITLTSLVSACQTHLVRMAQFFPSLEFSELLLVSTSGSKAMALCELRDCHTGRVSNTDCLRARSSGIDSRKALRKKLPLRTVAKF